MKDFVKQLYLELEEDLSTFSEIGTTPVNRLTGSLKCVAAALNNLKAFFEKQAFVSEADEIYFFKYQKPRFYCWNIYLVEEFSINNNLPIGSSGMQRQYYLNELDLIERTRNQYRTVYQYYLDHDTNRDKEYFLRSDFVSFLPGQDYNQPVDGFSTNQDYLFSKFRAGDMLQEFLILKIAESEKNVAEPLAQQLLLRNSRRWTGEKINLIEIAYGIYFTGQMNDGKADIKEIISWLETSLSISLSQAYRMFLDIRRRKTTRYAKFLESMSEAINQHIEESYNYKPKMKL
ncbi:MAG: RteC domain-containing protein [Mucilaginibacter sp.]